MTARTVTIEGRRYTVGVNWTPLPKEEATPTAVRDLVASSGTPFGYRIDRIESDGDDGEGPEVLFGFAGAKPLRAPSAAMRLARSVDGLAMYVAIVEDDSEPSDRYVICGVRDGAPDPSADVIVETDELITRISEVAKPWAASDINIDDVPVYTNDATIAEDNGFEFEAFEDLTAEVAYDDLPKARRLAAKHSPVRMVLIGAGIGLVAYVWMGLLTSEAPELDPPEKPEEQVSEESDPPAPDVPTWEERFEDTKAHLDNILDRYGAALRIDRALNKVSDAPDILGGWQVSRLVVSGGETATLVYKRTGTASLSVLLDRLGTTRSVSFGDNAAVARVRVPMKFKDRDHDVSKSLESTQEQWAAFADDLIRISPSTVEIINVRESDDAFESGTANNEDGESGAGLGAPKKTIQIPNLRDIESLAERPLIDEYRWELSFKGTLGLDRLREALSDYPLIALEVLVIDYTTNPNHVIAKGVFYEGA